MRDHVSVNIEKQRNGSEFTKVKFTKVLSVTEKYERKLPDEDLIYGDSLMTAISKNNIKFCREVLEKSGIFNFEKYFFHPLLLAAKKGRCEIIQHLLDAGADINVQDKKKFTALHYALQQCSLDCCNLLLENNIKIDAKDKFGNLPLHIAAFEGILPITTVLLESTENVNERNKKDQTPLHLAAIRGNDEIISLILSKGGRWDLKDVNFWLPLHFAAFNGHSKSCTILVMASGDKKEKVINSKNNDKETPIILAARKGHSHCCEALNSSDVNAQDKRGNSALHHAAYVGFMRTVEVLLNMGADVNAANKDGDTPVHKAAIQKNIDCIKILIEFDQYKPCLNKHKQTVLHLSAISNCTETLKYLLSNPKFSDQIDLQDDQGKTPLHIALNHGHSECAELLISNGSNCTLTDNRGNYPVHISSGIGLNEMCKLLLTGSKVRKVNERNSLGATPIHLAAMSGNLECCKVLLNKGADLNAIDSNGFSPFHVASLGGKVEILKLFTKRSGSFINQVVEISGDTNLHLAARKGFYDCCEFIIKNIKKDFLIKLNNLDNSVLDEAFAAGHDKVFNLVLSKIPIPKPDEKHKLEQYNSFQLSLHEYMHEAIANKRKIILKAILDSSWWYSGFSSTLCADGQCQNLVKLTVLDTQLAELAYDKCIEISGSTTVTYNFRLFDDSYYTPLESNAETCLKRHSPFNLDTGKLKRNALLYPKRGIHPLLVAADGEYLNLMQHDLTETYLCYKWYSYMWIILFLTVLCEATLVTFLGLYLNYVRNYDMLSWKNITRNESCGGDAIQFSSEGNSLDPSIYWNQSLCLYILLLIAGFGLMITEINLNRKVPYNLFSIVQALRVVRMVGICVLLFPANFCVYDIAIKETWQWEIGILTLLLSWFHMIHEINVIPALSVFMPLTRKFCESFVKVLFYTILILFIFSFIFHLLLQHKPAFVTLPISFIKTIVWVLGDLTYDETFVKEKSTILYPAMTNFMFILLVTSISGFFVNLVLTQPSDHMNVFRERAISFKAASRIQLFLRLDAVFDVIKKKYLIGFYVKKSPTISSKHVSESKSLYAHENGKISEQFFKCENDERLEKILKKLQQIEYQISDLKKK